MTKKMKVTPFVLKFLIDCAKKNEMITYEELAKKVGYKSGRIMGEILRNVDEMLCEYINDDAPILGGFVINKYKGIQGEGIKDIIIRKGYDYDELKENGQLNDIINKLNEEAHNYNWKTIEDKLFYVILEYIQN